jgi:hypothetical protein
VKTRNISNRLSIAMTLVAIVLLASSRSAAANRTWVAPSGDDNNACSNANPCKTFAGALAKTDARGEIVVKESGGFGAVTIDKSITIDSGRKYAGIQVSGSGNNGVTIQAGNTDVIVLRGLTIKGLGVGRTGIRTSSAFAGVLRVENCAISDFVQDGILGDSALLFIQDTVISGCAVAIDMLSGRAVIEHSRVENNYTGIFVQGAQVTARSTVASGNFDWGFESAWGTLNLENCVASNNGGGVAASFFSNPANAPGIVVISNSIVTNNQTGLQVSCVGGCSNSVMYSRGNNTVTGNDLDINGTITPLGGS